MCLVHCLKTPLDWSPPNFGAENIGSFRDGLRHNSSRIDSKGGKMHVRRVLVVLAVTQPTKKLNVNYQTYDNEWKQQIKKIITSVIWLSCVETVVVT